MSGMVVPGFSFNGFSRYFRKYCGVRRRPSLPSFGERRVCESLVTLWQAAQLSSPKRSSPDGMAGVEASCGPRTTVAFAGERNHAIAAANNPFLNRIDMSFVRGRRIDGRVNMAIH